MICLKKKVSELELSVSDLDNPKWPLGSFFVFMDEFKKWCLEVNPNIKSFDAVKKAGRGKWKRISDAEKAPYIAEAKKKNVEYAKVLDSYNWRMAAGYAEEGESVRPRSEFDPSNGSKDGENPCYSHLDKIIRLKKKARGLDWSRMLVRDLDNPNRPLSAFFAFMEELKKQFLEVNPNIKSLVAVGEAGLGKWKQMSDAEKAPYIRRSNMQRSWRHRRMAAGYAEEEESDKSRSDVNPSSGSKYREIPSDTHLGDNLMPKLIMYST
ncbi:high mobility group B protein 6-like isoform X2 [Lycium barbarum]|nr:high mobility group B protein 6-like isoform X2 [Lycium barbarum]